MASFTIPDILRVASYRISEAAFYFSMEAKRCSDKARQKYLKFLAIQKNTQKEVLFQIAKNLSLDISQFTWTDFSDYRYISKDPTSLAVLPLKEIYTYTYQHAIEEMGFFILLIPYTTDPNTRHVINTFIDLSRNFHYNARREYLKVLSRTEERYSPVYMKIKKLREGQKAEAFK